jgi:hypothetical protein
LVIPLRFLRRYLCEKVQGFSCGLGPLLAWDVGLIRVDPVKERHQALLDLLLGLVLVYVKRLRFIAVPVARVASLTVQFLLSVDKTPV